MRRSAERVEFLSDVLVGAIENYGYGWFAVLEYDIDAWTAKIEDSETGIIYDVDLDTIARGIGVIKDAVMTEFTDRGSTGSDQFATVEYALANVRTYERLYLSPESRKAIIQASRDNDAGDLDVVDCLAILECAIFGQVTYV